jgi:hypothetical protein
MTAETSRFTQSMIQQHFPATVRTNILSPNSKFFFFGRSRHVAYQGPLHSFSNDQQEEEKS